ncbi:MAG: nitroreductase family protein [Planctomycetota bacterium]
MPNASEPIRSFDEILRGRRTIHDYLPEPVDEAAIEAALATAIEAPNHRMTVPWRFARVGPVTRSKIADRAVDLGTKPGTALGPTEVDRIRSKIESPFELVVVSLVRNADPAIAREDYASGACAIQNLMLSLWAAGIGSKWSTGKITRDPMTYAAVGIDSENQEIIGFVWVGRPAKVPARPPRPDVAELVRRLP